MICMTVLCTVFSMIVWSSVGGRLVSATEIGLPNALDCNQKMYEFPVSNTDVNGRTCFDKINVMSCWGRCDSNEVTLVNFLYFIINSESPKRNMGKK